MRTHASELSLSALRALWKAPKAPDRWYWLRRYVWRLVRPAIITAAGAVVLYILGVSFAAGVTTVFDRYPMHMECEV